ncbi:hypothetical protein B0H11DRAFT_1369017 [Mycena galericulata]|nr:hypothetical protein B0H11DRAFT_1369017 [Mycena galericulata]
MAHQTYPFSTSSSPAGGMTRVSEAAQNPADTDCTISVEDAERTPSYPRDGSTANAPGHNAPHGAQWDVNAPPPTSMGSRAHSFGYPRHAPVELSGFRRRAWSHHTSFSAMNPAAYRDEFAVDDDWGIIQSFPSDLQYRQWPVGEDSAPQQPAPSHTPPPHPTLLSPTWTPGARPHPSLESPFPGHDDPRLPSPAEQTGTLRFHNSTPSPVTPAPLSPSLLSPPWRSDADSDTSSIRSLSPSLGLHQLPPPGIVSPGYDGVSPDPYHHRRRSHSCNRAYESNDEVDASVRGRSIWRVDRRSRSRISSADPSVAGIDGNMEALTIDGDGTSSGPSFHPSHQDQHSSTNNWQGHPAWTNEDFHQPPTLHLQIPQWPHGSHNGSTSSSSSRSPSRLPAHLYLPSDSLDSSARLDDSSFEADVSQTSGFYTPAVEPFYSPTILSGDREVLPHRAPVRRRRRSEAQSPYPPSPSVRGSVGQLANWDMQDSVAVQGRDDPVHPGHSQDFPPYGPDVADDGPESRSLLWEGQPEAEGSAPGPSQSQPVRTVATAATRRAAAARRRDPSKPGAFVCEVCGQDLTAKHNYKNHMNSHNSVKPFGCGKCGQRFGTQHVLKRHEPKCPSDSKKVVVHLPYNIQR